MSGEITMKTNTTLSLLVASVLLSTSSLVLAHGQGGAAEYDTDGNGVVTAAEMLAGRTADFNTADADTSTTLTLAEFLNLENTVQTRRIAAAFAKVDTNTDSVISVAEFTASANATSATYLTNVFNLADKNADAGLSLTEFTELQSKGSNSGIWEFARMDSNSDKLVSLTEFTVMPTAPAVGTQPMDGGKGGRGGKR
jgi:hypothetical protein